MPYDTIAQRWHDFYIVAGTSAATLVGLLFVGLSLHLRVVVSRPEVRSLARVTLANFGLILLVSLFMVIRQTATSASTQLVFSGVISLLIIAPSVAAAARSRTRTIHLVYLVMRFALSAGAYIGVIVAGALVGGKSYQPALGLLEAIVVILLVIGLRNSWDLLVSVGESVGHDR